jgi:hypothetical protein
MANVLWKDKDGPIVADVAHSTATEDDNIENMEFCNVASKIRKTKQNKLRQ